MTQPTTTTARELDLVQTVDQGFENEDGTVDWISRTRYIVPASNRRRILDREHRNGITPAADGWLYCDRRDLSTRDLQCIALTRISWDDPRYF